MQAIKQRTKDLGMKTLLLRCKKQDLEKEAERYEQLCQVADFFQRPVITVSGEAHSSCMKDVETSCQVSNVQILGVCIIDHSGVKLIPILCF